MKKNNSALRRTKKRKFDRSSALQAAVCVFFVLHVKFVFPPVYNKSTTSLRAVSPSYRDELSVVDTPYQVLP